MLVEVGGRKFKMNWRHEQFRNAGEEWLARYASELPDSAKMSLREALKGVPAMKRRGRTTCIIEEVDCDLRITAITECSRLDQYRKERGRVESLERALKELAWQIGPGQNEGTEEAAKAALKADKDIRTEVFKQYAARKNGNGRA